MISPRKAVAVNDGEDHVYTIMKSGHEGDYIVVYEDAYGFVNASEYSHHRLCNRFEDSDQIIKLLECPA